MAQKLYIKTFGCQMNEYDSAKMADVLAAAEGMESTDDPAEADVILFNTCSVREKAQEKVFHDLGRVKHLKRARPGLIIGVGGCVASQEGAAIVARAPYVDVVFGPQTLHRLPELIAARRRTGRPQVDISFPEIEKFDRLPPARVEGVSAFVSIMEGCSKYCSFCVVPYTRGEEVSRPFEDVLAEVAELALAGRERGHPARPERERLPRQHRRRRGWRARQRRFRAAPGIRRGNPRHRAHPLHHLASEGIHPATDRRLRQHPEAREPRAPAAAVGLGPRARGDEARLHRAGVQIHRAPAARRAARHLDFIGLHRRLSRRNRARFRRDHETRRPRSASTTPTPFSTARGRARRRRNSPTTRRRR